MILIRFLRDFFYFPPVALLGWFKLLSNFLEYLYFSWKKYPVFIRFAILFLVFQIIFASRPWFEYKIRFYESSEFLFVSSKINLIFIFFSILNFFLLLINSSVSNLFALCLQGIIGILFLIGFQSPTSLHIDFINPNDYSFSLNFYIFFLFYLITLSLSVTGYFKSK